MKQLTYICKRKLDWWDVPEPEIQAPTEALVRPFVASRCDGDHVFLFNDLTRLIRLGVAVQHIDPKILKTFGNKPFQGPFPYGHECVAEVMQVGEGIHSFAVGDVVILPWSVSCGSCNTCGKGLTSLCETANENSLVSGYGFGSTMGPWGGMVSDLVRVPYADNMLIAVPDKMDPVSISAASDNIPDAWRTVGPPLEKFPGAPVLVMGGSARSIGLYAAGIAVALGSTQVDYVDSDPERLRISESLGANPIEAPKKGQGYKKGQLFLSDRYPITVDASANRETLSYALRALAPGGVCTSVGFYFNMKTPLPLWDMYATCATFITGASHPRHDMPKAMPLIESGVFKPQLITTLLADWSDAAEAFVTTTTKVVIHRERIMPEVG